MARPDLSYLKNLTLAIVGIPCGVLTGVTGLSAAPILQPTLKWLIGLDGAPLAGVVLVMVSFTAWSGLFSFGQAGHVQWLNGFLVTMGTFFGAALAGNAIKKSPSFFVKMRHFWSLIPLALAMLMIAQATGIVDPAYFARPLLPTMGYFLPLFWSLLIGIAVGFIGIVGELGSMLTVPLLLYLLGRSIWEAEGTALYVLVLASLPTALIHALSKTLNSKAAIFLSIGGLLGALYGSHIAVSAAVPVHPNFLIFLCGAVLAAFSLGSLFQKPLPILPADTNDPTRMA
jgi:uncharacterized membrane protein YfcA